jgi:hypothetical protein
MLYLSKTILFYRFYKILVIEPTTEVKAESIRAPSVKEIDTTPLASPYSDEISRGVPSDSHI